MDLNAKCPFCGHEQRLISRFCPNCGRDRWIAPEFSSQYRSARTRSRLTIALLAACGILSAISAVLVFVRYRWAATSIEGTSLPGIESVGSAIASVYVLAFIATAIVFLAWQSRSIDNVPHLTGSHPAVTPAWSVVWWFIPIANLFKPYLIITDLNERLETAKSGGGERLILGWWLIWLTGRLVFVALGITQQSRTELQPLLPLLAGIDLLEVVAAALAIVVVSRIQARADERAQYITRASTIPSERTANGVALPPCPRCGGAREAGRQLCPTCGLDLWAAYDEVMGRA